jgi:hypothetical protein
VSERPLPDQFRHFADSTERDGATTYTAICRGVADNAEVLSLLGAAPLAQRRPNILLAAVHFLLLGGVEHDLAAHYDTVRSGLTSAAPQQRVADDFIAFCAEHRDEVVHLVSTRSTQTNEIGRCSALYPAFSSVGALYPGQPLALLDLGASAGLNLLLDHYAYSYVPRDDGTAVRVGDANSPVTLDCVVRGDPLALPLNAPPSIAVRVGLDLSPLDPTSADDARWLLACLWPDNLARFTRLQAALSMAGTVADPPTMHRGDIVVDLASVTSTIDNTLPVIIFHSWVAAYLTAERQRELVQAVRAVAAARPVHYIYAEQTAETPGLPTPPAPDSSPLSDLRTAVVHIDLDLGSGGGQELAPVRLADMHPHGRWLKWWAAP